MSASAFLENLSSTHFGLHYLRSGDRHDKFLVFTTRRHFYITGFDIGRKTSLILYDP
jgi:hypothetical protein